MSEQQQWLQIQQWFKQNALYLIIFSVLTLAAVGGWNYWQHSQFQHKSAASDLYQQVIDFSTENQLTEARSALTQLEKNYIDTAYPFLGNLQLAKQAYLSERMDIAKETLQWVVINAEDENFIYMAADRLVRVYIDQKETQKVVDLVNEVLGKIANESSVASLNMSLGDAYMLEKNMALARTAYETAKQNLPHNSSLKELIDMKLRDAASL